MMRIDKVLKRPRLCQALTGLTPDEFKLLLPTFEACWLEHLNRPNRKRDIGGGRKGIAPASKDKLFYILFFYKVYPTFDVMSFLHDCNRSNALRRKAAFEPVLEKSLGKKLVLPQRQITSVEEFFKAFPEAKDVFVDGAERPRQRPKNKAKQKAHYTGKKKRHTDKNLIVTDKDKRIGYLSQTVPGAVHDYSLFKTTALPDHIPKNTKVHTDSGFQGIESDYPSLNVSIPRKKPKGKKLSGYQRSWNKRRSRQRVVVEHGIGGAKRLRIVTDVFRNKKAGLSDRAMYLACGLWNFHLTQMS